MLDKTIYYSVIGYSRTEQSPSGLVRRRPGPNGTIDEALQRDLTWVPSSAIVQWEGGDVGAALIEISEVEAEALIERFRQKWADG
jgi:hypothetical protein